MAYPAPSRPWILGVVLAVVLAAGSGCGYHFVQYKAALPGASTLAIRPLENKTFEPGVEAVVLDALRREALERDGLRLIDDPEAADLVIDGKVSNLTVKARSFTSIVLSVEYEVTMGLNLVLQPREGEPVPFDPRAPFERDRYLASADLEAMRKNRREAIHRLASLLADRVYDSLYESAAAGAIGATGSSTATP